MVGTTFSLETTSSLAYPHSQLPPTREDSRTEIYWALIYQAAPDQTEQKKKPCLSFPSGLAKGKQSSGISALKRVLYRSGEGNPTAQATSRVSLISS